MKITLKPYIIGFISSLVLTFAAWWLIWEQVHSGHRAFTYPFLAAAVLVLAMVQLCVQLLFFMHLGAEKGPRWKLGVFVSTFGIILIIVVGAIWIMGHLNYNMMASPSQMDAYIQSQDGL